MPKKPSAETELRHANRRIKELGRMLDKVTSERNDYHMRYLEAQREAAEWKERFDVLLTREAKESR